MAKPILMPQVGQDLETAIITEWFVKENDKVKKGDIIATVESEKAVFEVEAFESGTILKILYQPGEEAKVLEPIAYIGEPGESLEEQDTVKPESINSEDIDKPGKLTQKPTPVKEGKILATPSARRVAREHGIDLTTITGSGPDGRITKEDVLTALNSDTVKTAPSPSIEPIPTVQDIEKEGVVPFSKMKRRIAERMVTSKQTIPHFYLFMDVDMTVANAWRNSFNYKSDVKISVNDLIVKAAAQALKKYPQLNSRFENYSLIIEKNINIGIAVAVDEGLIVPVIENADWKKLEEIAKESKELAQGARNGILKSQTIGTFTISNLGMFDINYFLPIINPHECAILGVGRIEKRIIPLENNVTAVRDILTLSLSCDHRVIDGATGARFLKEIKDFLEKFNL